MLENDAIGMHIHMDEAFLMVWEFQACHILQPAHCPCLESPRFFILQTMSARIKRRKNEVAVFLSELRRLPQLKQAKKEKKEKAYGFKDTCSMKKWLRAGVYSLRPR